MADAEHREIKAILLPHRARGAITLDECPAWARRLRADRPFAEEALDALPGNDALADRMFAEDAEIRSLKHQLDRAMGVSEDRAFDHSAGLTESERLYRQLAEATNEHLFVR